MYNAFKDHKEIRAKVLLQKLIEMYRKAEDYKNFPYSKVKQRSNSELHGHLNYSGTLNIYIERKKGVSFKCHLYSQRSEYLIQS